MEMEQVESQFVVKSFQMKISRKHMTKQVNSSSDFEWHISWYFHFLEGNRNNAKKNQENQEELQDILPNWSIFVKFWVIFVHFRQNSVYLLVYNFLSPGFLSGNVPL